MSKSAKLSSVFDKEVVVGNVLNLAVARALRMGIAAQAVSGSPLARRVSAADELAMNIPQNARCHYWPAPGFPQCYLRLPLNGRLSQEAMRILHEGTAVVVIDGCESTNSLRCSVTNVRQRGSHLDFELSLREPDRKNELAFALMGKEVVRISLTAGSFTTNRTSPGYELITPL